MGRSRSGAVAVWVAVITAVCVLSILGITIYSFAKSPQLFVGRTTLMVRGAITGVKVADLPGIITGPEVKARTEKTLRVLGIVIDPGSISKVNTESVPGTSFIRINVESADPEVAKASADVYAAEFRRLMQERTGKAPIASKKKLPGGTIRIVTPASAKKVGDVYTARAVIAPGKSTPPASKLNVNELATIASSQTVVSRTANALTTLLSSDNVYAHKIFQTLKVGLEPGGHAVGVQISANDPKIATAAVEALIAATRGMYESVTRPAPGPIKIIEPAFVYPK